MRVISQNAFVIAGDAANTGSVPQDGSGIRYGGFAIRQNPISDGGRLQVLENEQYTLLLRGHFYCEAAHSLEANENLGLLLEEIRIRGSFAKALATITGGIYSLFAIDRQRGSLQVTVDRTASMPLYFRNQRGGVEFSNNQFVFQEEPSELAVCEFLKYGYLPISESLFEGVHRLGPGEIVSWKPGFQTTRNRVHSPCHEYLPPDRRTQNPAEAAERLAAAFDRYFARLGSGRGISGLSGGYDSRLIAAYCAEKNVEFFNFGHPNSREVLMAQLVAKRLGRPLNCFRIPEDAVARHGERFPSVMTALDSFEDAHILELIDRTVKAKAEFSLDGYIGDTIVGGNYFYNLAQGLSGLLPWSRTAKRFESVPLETHEYVSMIYGNRRAVPDAELHGLMTDEFRDLLRGKARKVVEAHQPNCPTHEDLRESLIHRIRGNRLIAGGPVAGGAVALAGCPFIDRTVFETAMNCAKHVRAGDRLYNALWRLRFPQLADLPKSNTGGRAIDSDWGYRMNHLRTAILRRAIDPGLNRLTRGLRDRTESYSSSKTYLANPANQKFMQALVGRSADCLPQRIAEVLTSPFASGVLHPLVSLRLCTLLEYLG